MTGKTSSMTGKSIKILINNVPMTSENDLKAIAANKIKKVEYYEDPPIRYGDVGIYVELFYRMGRQHEEPEMELLYFPYRKQ